MSSLLATASGVGAFLGLLVWFRRLERRGDRHRVFTVFASVMMFDAVIAGLSSHTPVGLLRPAIAGQDFRAVDLVLLAALIARFLATPRGRPRVPQGVLPWLAFCAWYLFAFAVGRAYGQPLADALYQAKTLFYLLGAMVLAAGVDLRRLAQHLTLPAVLLALAVPVGVAVQLAGLRIAVSTPVQDFIHLGKLSNDTITMLVGFGGAVLVVEGVSQRRRPVVVLCALVLLMAPAAADQRASYLSLGAVIATLGTVVLGRTWRRRSPVPPLFVAAFAVVLAGLGAGGLVVTGSADVVTERFDDTFVNGSVTTDARVDLAGAARTQIAERPFLGGGLGQKVTVRTTYSPKLRELSAHNFVLDVALRSGLIGVGLMLFAIGVTVRTGITRWRHEADTRVAALCLAATMGMGAMLAKSLVEPALEKYRLATMLGLCAGIVLVAGRSSMRTAVHQEEEPQELLPV